MQFITDTKKIEETSPVPQLSYSPREKTSMSFGVKKPSLHQRNTSPRIFDDSFLKSSENLEKSEQESMEPKKITNHAQSKSNKFISISPRMPLQKGSVHNSQRVLTTYKSKRSLDQTISSMNLNKNKELQIPEYESLQSENEQLKTTLK